MHAHRRLTFARFLAPLALIASTVAVLAIVMGSGVTGDDSSSGSAGTRDLPAATDKTTTTATGRKQTKIPKTYVIRANDTLSGIGARWGLTVEQLQELNPELDPQGLVAGQKIKLRE
ncbi:MAG: LysM peptidoglycan-binding domain-containing protein [Thermoleophilaceae bacterium]